MVAEFEGYILALADELEALLTGRLSATEFEDRYLSKYQEGVVPPVVLDLITSVTHYLSDEDIRSRDAEYRQMQECEMRKLIDALRSGQLDLAARISFLGPSRSMS